MALSVTARLLKELAKIDRPGTFCTSGRLPTVLPGLEISSVGPVSLPLTKRQAGQLKAEAHQAPYGKGEQTLVDTDVRRVWEIDAEQITLANPEWSDVVEEAVRTVQEELGLEKQKLQAHLYKLLLYEPGSFFLSHQDGEKLDRMVATLVIALPSAHVGGELIVRHEGQESTVHFGGPDSRFQTQFAAFYADCEHEIRPVTEGFRLALVYNLTLAKSKRTIRAPRSSEHVAAIAEILRDWAACHPAGDDQKYSPSKLAVLLDHEYTKAGLSPDALKGTDRGQAAVLFEAARQARGDASLALVTKWQTGSAEPIGGYGYRRYGYYDDGDASNYEMGEVHDESLTAENFLDPGGKRLDFGEIPLDEEELVSEEPITQWEPDETDFEGYTGNAGMTLERWYHRAAVILWPQDSRFDVLCEAGIETAVAGLEQMVSQWKKGRGREREDLQSQCLAFAERILDRWPQCDYAHDSSYPPRGTSGQERFLPSLEKLGDAALIARWITHALARDATVDPGKTLGNVCKQHGWQTFETELRTLFEQTHNETIERHARILANFSLRKDKNADRRGLCAELGREMVTALKRWDAETTRKDWRASSVDRPAVVSCLVQSFLALEEPELLEGVIEHVLSLPEKYPLTDVQIPAIAGLRPWLKRNVKRSSAPLSRWLTAVGEELDSRADNPPGEPADWTRPATISCNCADCKEVSRFLKDPETKTLRLPLAKRRRQHLHQIIDGNRLDLTHQTERRGRPYTLVCTKTNASYQRALKAHQDDLKHQDMLRQLLEWHQALSEK
jgi:predicted 2-oxoglutarate/Fe(II)-dependent dioxygenase YbiX